MTGRTLAKITWRALDHAGDDSCQLARMDDGWMLVGHARFQTDGQWSALDYVVRCGDDWLTQSADVTGKHKGDAVALRVARQAGRWTCNDRPLIGLDEAVDIDLGFTPATNLMPVRRLPEVGRLRTRAAWLRDPAEPFAPLDQSYTRERGGLVHYVSEQTQFQTHLQVDASGFVTLYPDLWEAVHAP